MIYLLRGIFLFTLVSLPTLPALAQDPGQVDVDKMQRIEKEVHDKPTIDPVAKEGYEKQVREINSHPSIPNEKLERQLRDASRNIENDLRTKPDN
ncbi:hypothetical protein [Rhizobium sp. P44RR-XXIV]|uniref:hypothetical protein n=1 Tax=Rhizobium sp. P44RR-XXIV TaxID=1921145 RepID=UPI0009871E4D|nr:hypothetical protein [Rhizobium sp. P44RR-XXIV]TIX89207.1 hypothetical protein BSK43_021625 [Rhizobium sp. P44RR-XXIV]